MSGRPTPNILRVPATRADVVGARMHWPTRKLRSGDTLSRPGGQLDATPWAQSADFSR